MVEEDWTKFDFHKEGGQKPKVRQFSASCNNECLKDTIYEITRKNFQRIWEIRNGNLFAREYIKDNQLESFEFTIHQTKRPYVVSKKGLFTELEAWFSKETKAIYAELRKREIALREDIVERIIAHTIQLIQNSNSQAQKFDCKISFKQITPIKGEQQPKANVLNMPNYWAAKFSQQALICNNIKDQLSEDIKVAQVLSSSNKGGFVLFKNCPDNSKHSIYSFSHEKKNPLSLLQFQTQILGRDVTIGLNPDSNKMFTYKNCSKQFYVSGYSKQFKLNDMAEIYGVYKSDGIHAISQIVSACFKFNSNEVLILNQDGCLFSLDTLNQNVRPVLKGSNFDDEEQPQEIIRAPEGQKFVKILSSSDGKKIIIASHTALFFYDCFWNLILEIPHCGGENLDLKQISNEEEELLFVKTEKSEQLYLLHSTNSAKQVIKKEIRGKDKAQKLRGNPLIDAVCSAFKKFGPHSNFIGCPASTKLALNSDLTKAQSALLEGYFKSLGLTNCSFNLLPKEGSSFFAQPSISQKIFFSVLMSRIPIQLATIENYTLMPLQNGCNIQDKIIERLLEQAKVGEDDFEEIATEEKSDLVEKIIEMITVGIFEHELLVNRTKPLYVISIVGKQSGGKSYVMNRFFGTRFDVASERCTDGIWMSLTKIKKPNGEEQDFVILDCEGLFSAQRNEQEEIKLCLTLSALSDILILNQDLSFNRHLNHIFQSFTKSIGRIRGRNLFKGKFMNLIRDLKGSDSQGAFQEVQAVFKPIQMKKNNFIELLFQGQLLNNGLNHFDSHLFEQEIEAIRGMYFLGLNTERWKNGSEFLENMKITLAQVFADDDTDVDEHKLKLMLDKSYQSCVSMFRSGESFGDLYSTITVIISKKVFQIRINQSEFKLERQHSRKQDDEDEPVQMNSLQGLFQTLTESYSGHNHNDWMAGYNQFLSAIITQRQEHITKTFESMIALGYDDSSPLIKSQILKLQRFMDTHARQFRTCMQSCQICARTCRLEIDHKIDCNCKTNHQCQLPCLISDNCLAHSYECVELYGHEGEHRCKEGSHRCSEDCGILGCKYNCSLEVSHPEDRQHRCGNRHPCPQKCDDAVCKKNCKYDLAEDHCNHVCADTVCPHSCSLCNQRCVFPNHMHQQMIIDGDLNELEVCFLPGAKESLLIDYHICDQIHQCKHLCSEKGLCSVDYRYIEKIWKNEMGEFPYTYFQPIEQRKNCQQPIERYQRFHSNGEGHKCSVILHRCIKQCPECKSYCNLTINHLGNHNTESHRNKESSQFVVKIDEEERKTVTVEGLGGRKREYKAGESCQPENCSTSCQRKGRSHYHLVECNGYCKANGVNVRHSKDRYMPYPKKSYDQHLCAQYWQQQQWEPPFQPQYKKEIAGCNAYCSHRQHFKVTESLLEDIFAPVKTQYAFCQNTAWHLGPHKFDCGHVNKCLFTKVDIVFCVDATGSMGPYLYGTKNTVRKIMTHIKVGGGAKKDVKFAFVAYKDHSDEFKTFLTKSIDLTDSDQVENFIGRIEANGGGGDGAEAVMDGLHEAINKISWRPDSARYLFHVADAPPQGIEYGLRKHTHYPDGCPCGITLKDIAQGIKKLNISYKLIKIGHWVNKMAQIFSQAIDDYEKMDISNAMELVDRVSEVIVRELETQEIDVLVMK